MQIAESKQSTNTVSQNGTAKRSFFFQPKLTINQSNDVYEQEADPMADKVMRMTDNDTGETKFFKPAISPIQRRCEQCEKEEKKMQRKEVNGKEAAYDIMLEDYVGKLNNNGQILPKEVRSFYEPRLGQDFSNVKIHTDTVSAKSAQSINALAYTSGNNIVFNQNQFRPETVTGKKLLAHELTHVVQQKANPSDLARHRPNFPQEEPVHNNGKNGCNSILYQSLGKGFAPSLMWTETFNHRSPAQIQRQEGQSVEKPLVSDDALLACLAFAPLPLKFFCFDQEKSSSVREEKRKSFGGGGASGSWSPAPATGVRPPAPPPPAPALETFFHGSTWRIAQSIPGNVKPIAGGDFGQGFYTHHNIDKNVAAERARWEGCRLCQKMSPSERYAGIIRFDVSESRYRSLFPGRKAFNLTSTTQKDYAAQQKKWLDFVSGRHGGREESPTFDTAHMSWRHQRVDPPPGHDYLLIEGPMYKGVEGLPGSSVPPRSAFDPYAEGTILPQQVVWNYQQAMDVLNDASTTLSQYDAKNNCSRVDPPVKVQSGKAIVAEDAKALEAAQIELTGH